MAKPAPLNASNASAVSPLRGALGARGACGGAAVAPARATGHALVLLASLGIGALGCGPSPALEEPRYARVGVRWVCVEGCPEAVDVASPTDDVAVDEVEPEPDDASASRGPAGGVTYVAMTDWESPASVRAFEVAHPPRGEHPLTVTRFPALRLHRPIPASGRYR